MIKCDIILYICEHYIGTYNIIVMYVGTLCAVDNIGNCYVVEKKLLWKIISYYVIVFNYCFVYLLPSTYLPNIQVLLYWFIL